MRRVLGVSAWECSLGVEDRFRFQIFYCFTPFTKIITLTLFTEITLIKKRKEI